MEILQSDAKYGTIFVVKDGWIVCPNCRSKMHGIRVTPGTQARNLELRCERCKAEYKLDIDSGQCSLSSRRPE